MLARIDHVQLAMPPAREAEALAFYGRVLGLKQEAKPPELARRGGCWFTSSDGFLKLHLGVEEAFQPQKKAHPALLSDEIGGLARRLAESNYPVAWDDLAGRTRFYTRDPFGNRLEIMKMGDGFTER
mmetsp:Transcript_48762/g.119414  ORF Transcript_48762/g.119414 Transcript_48762/m.119414 type:complete len:127 (-) Transcript_48762:185-565(-)